MAGSIYGSIIRISTFGESHGPALGVVVDGFPSGVAVSPADIQHYLDRRRPGRSGITTSRSEADEIELLSGVFEGKTTGTPLAMLVRNTSQRSGDYDALREIYRPGHADYGFDQKYGLRDHRGGGRSSGRETVGRVAAGALCQLLLKQLGISCYAYTESIGPISIREAPGDTINRDAILKSRTGMPDDAADKEACALIERLKSEQDSIGGAVVCVIEGMPAGVGDPVFDRLDALLSHAVMSIGAVKAVEIGDGVLVSKRRGSENNDAFLPGSVRACGSSDSDHFAAAVKRTNHAGGILGGISDGSPILLRAHFKPTPSISGVQDTIDREGNPVTIAIKGRHDPVIVPRAVVVVEAMCAITVLDALLVNMSARSEKIMDFYGRH